MPKVQKVGSGMTEATRVMYDVSGDNPDDIVAARDAFRAGARDVFENGLWGATTELMRFHCEDILHDKDRHEDFEADTAECFARRILRYLAITDNCIAEGLAERAAVYGLKAGELWAAARLKWAQESTWKTGNTQRRALSESRERTNREQQANASRKHTCWQIEAERIWETKPNLTKVAVAKSIAKTHGGSQSTIRQVIKKPDSAG